MTGLCATCSVTVGELKRSLSKQSGWKVYSDGLFHRAKGWSVVMWPSVVRFCCNHERESKKLRCFNGCDGRHLHKLAWALHDKLRPRDRTETSCDFVGEVK